MLNSKKYHVQSMSLSAYVDLDTAQLGLHICVIPEVWVVTWRMSQTGLQIVETDITVVAQIWEVVHWTVVTTVLVTNIQPLHGVYWKLLIAWAKYQHYSKYQTYIYIHTYINTHIYTAHSSTTCPYTDNLL